MNVSPACSWRATGAVAAAALVTFPFGRVHEEVGQPRPQALGLADVEHTALGILELIRPSPSGIIAGFWTTDSPDGSSPTLPHTVSKRLTSHCMVKCFERATSGPHCRTPSLILGETP